MTLTLEYLLTGLGVGLALYTIAKILRMEFGVAEITLVTLIWPAVLSGVVLISLYNVFTSKGKDGDF